MIYIIIKIYKIYYLDYRKRRNKYFFDHNTVITCVERILTCFENDNSYRQTYPKMAKIILFGFREGRIRRFQSETTVCFHFLRQISFTCTTS